MIKPREGTTDKGIFYGIISEIGKCCIFHACLPLYGFGNCSAKFQRCEFQYLGFLNEGTYISHSLQIQVCKCALDVKENCTVWYEGGQGAAFLWLALHRGSSSFCLHKWLTAWVRWHNLVKGTKIGSKREVGSILLWTVLLGCGLTLQVKPKPELMRLFQPWEINPPSSIHDPFLLYYSIPILLGSSSQQCWSLRLKLAASSSFSTRSQFKAHLKEEKAFEAEEAEKRNQTKEIITHCPRWSVSYAEFDPKGDEFQSCFFQVVEAHRLGPVNAILHARLKFFLLLFQCDGIEFVFFS